MTTTTATTAPTTRATAPYRARAATLVAAPLLVLASELAAPRWADGLTPRQDAAFLLEHQQRFLVSGLLGVAAGAMIIAALTVVATAAWRRGALTLRVASVLGVAGGAGLVMHQTTTLDGRDVLMDDPTAYQAVDALAGGTSTIVAILLVVFGLNLAWIVMAVGARRAGLAGWWVVGAAVLAVVADFSPTSWNTTLWSLPALAVAVVVARGVARGGV